MLPYFYKYFAPNGDKNMSQFFRQASTLTLLLISASATLAETQTNPQDQEESSRQIVLDRFNKARPAADVTAGGGGSRAGAKRNPLKTPGSSVAGPDSVAGAVKGSP